MPRKWRGRGGRGGGEEKRWRDAGDRGSDIEWRREASFEHIPYDHVKLGLWGMHTQNAPNQTITWAGGEEGERREELESSRVMGCEGENWNHEEDLICFNIAHSHTLFSRNFSLSLSLSPTFNIPYPLSIHSKRLWRWSWSAAVRSGRFYVFTAFWLSASAISTASIRTCLRTLSKNKYSLSLSCSLSLAHAHTDTHKHFFFHYSVDIVKFFVYFVVGFSWTILLYLLSLSLWYLSSHLSTPRSIATKQTNCGTSQNSSRTSSIQTPYNGTIKYVHISAIPAHEFSFRSALTPIRLTEGDTTASSRIFIKILFQEIAEFLGLQKLNTRWCGAPFFLTRMTI